MGDVVRLTPWEVYEFPWGSAVKSTRGKWTHVFIAGPEPQEINVEHLDVVLHENGIEFVQGGD